MTETPVKLNGKNIKITKEKRAAAYAGAIAAKTCSIVDKISPDNSNFNLVYNAQYPIYLNSSAKLLDTCFITECANTIQIVEGTSISTINGTKKHIASLDDGVIKVRCKNSSIPLSVISKNRYTLNSPSLCITECNFLILPDSFSFYPSKLCTGPAFIKSRGSIPLASTKSEVKAQETLRSMISEFEYYKYLKYGFISVTSKSGKTYQIFRDYKHIKVWLNGVLIEELCSYIEDPTIPPTDKVIAFMFLALSNEESLRDSSNLYILGRIKP